MPKIEEVTAPIAATRTDKENITKCLKFTGSQYLNDWESTFIASLYRQYESEFALLLSKKQRHHLAKIWEKLYDQGLIT